MKRIEKIRAEVEKILVENRQRSSVEGYAAVEQLRRVLAYIDRMQKEPVSEDLEEAARKHALQCHSKASVPTLVASVHDFKAGANWQKEQMMKDVVLETTIIRDDDGSVEDGNYLSWLEYEDCEVVKMPKWAKEGDKVKLIIVKED